MDNVIAEKEEYSQVVCGEYEENIQNKGEFEVK